jgi:hypothetical protein
VLIFVFFDVLIPDAELAPELAPEEAEQVRQLHLDLNLSFVFATP